MKKRKRSYFPLLHPKLDREVAMISLPRELSPVTESEAGFPLPPLTLVLGPRSQAWDFAKNLAKMSDVSTFFGLLDPADRVLNELFWPDEFYHTGAPFNIPLPPHVKSDLDLFYFRSLVITLINTHIDIDFFARTALQAIDDDPLSMSSFLLVFEDPGRHLVEVGPILERKPLVINIEPEYSYRFRSPYSNLTTLTLYDQSRDTWIKQVCAASKKFIEEMEPKDER
jgi:hypothetical protein